jgi:hypothetical protein
LDKQQAIVDAIVDKGNKEIQEISDLLEPFEGVESFTARNQMNHFLSKSELNNPIINEKEVVAVFDAKPVMALYKECSQISQITFLKDFAIENGFHIFTGTILGSDMTTIKIESAKIEQFLQEYDRFSRCFDSRSLSEKQLQLVVQVKPLLEDLVRTIQIAYEQNNGKFTCEWIEETVKLSQKYEQIRIELLRPIEKSTQEHQLDAGASANQESRIAEAVKALDDLSSEVTELETAMNQAIQERLREFPVEMKQALVEGIKAITKNIVEGKTLLHG